MTPSTDDIAAMKMAEDLAAGEFWAYPSAEWQANFQRQWLLARGFPSAVTVDGVTYGEA